MRFTAVHIRMVDNTFKFAEAIADRNIVRMLGNLRFFVDLQKATFGIEYIGMNEPRVAA